MNSTHWSNLDTLKINTIVAIVVGILLLVKHTILCQLSPLHIFPSLSLFWINLGEPFVLYKLNILCKLQSKGDALYVLYRQWISEVITSSLALLTDTKQHSLFFWRFCLMLPPGLKVILNVWGHFYVIFESHLLWLPGNLGDHCLF